MARSTVPDLPDNSPLARRQASPAHNHGSLSPLLLACITRVTRTGDPIADSEEVYALLTEGDMELASQYSSPFENDNPEQRYPTLTAMLQSGDMVDSLGRVAGGTGGGIMGALQNGNLTGALSAGLATAETLAAKAVVALGGQDMMQGLVGRSAYTKVNSTQIYVSTNPVRLSCTLFLRAWKSARREVEGPLSLLEDWALPEELSRTGLLENLASNNGILNSLFPSKMPPFVALKYAGRTYKPLLLESVSAPLVVERDQAGNRLAVSVQCAFVSRTAWDKRDMQQVRGFR